MENIAFKVRADTKPGETVCVTGDCDSLGNWAVAKVLPLQFSKHGNMWVGTATVPNTVSFRYVICTIKDSNDEKRKVIIHRWETHIKPRTVSLTAKKTKEVHEFGSQGCNSNFQRGWLTTETVIQLKLFNINIPTGIWNPSFADKRFQLKVTAAELGKNNVEISGKDSDVHTEEEKEIRPKSHSVVEIAVMNEHECEFSSQRQFGRLYDPGECIIFQLQAEDINDYVYVIDFFLHDANLEKQRTPEHIGFSHLLPNSFKDGSSGSCVVPITGMDHKVIGQMAVEYLIVRPMANYECDMKVSYANHWNHRREALDVGHRGSGCSFTTDTNSATIRENTIASFKHAADHGADFIEFDVHLTKDLVPVIYHDFFVCVSAKKKNGKNEDEFIVVPVQNLTFQQLHSLRAHHLSELSRDSSLNERHFMKDGDEDHQPFPSLKKVFESINIHVGFNIEIKRSLCLKDGTQELDNQIDENLYADVILKEIFENARDRRIILSCFHPDVCTMLRLKQNKYPVLLLTQGQTKKYPPYMDPRTSSIPMAIFYAKSASILGIDVHTEDILEDKTLVQLCKDAGLAMFCWGKDNNDPTVISELKNLGLNGVIYDRIDQLKSMKENIFLMEARQLNAIQILKMYQK